MEEGELVDSIDKDGPSHPAAVRLLAAQELEC